MDRELVAHIKDEFVYFDAYYPDFREEFPIDRSQYLQSFAERVSAIKAAKGVSKHWLELCRKDMLAALDLDARQDFEGAKKHVKSASEYFDYFVSRKPLRADFIVDTDGSVRKHKGGELESNADSLEN